ncbi:MAG: alkaline phosphatase D family protein, partial [Bdellovibrionales bacterium]|nr:alkaline phosphatase D family protein [Bdellovibrionales bacterium]
MNRNWLCSIFNQSSGKILVVLWLALAFPCSWAASTNDASTPIQLFTFGSCNKETLPQPLWPAIEALKPQFFMWVGDSVYGDTSNADILKKKYQKQLHQPEYSRLIGHIPIIGTWDDHDYGKNNAGRNWQYKDIAQIYFLDFIGEPLTSPRRQQSGLYTSYLYGPPHRQIKLILLDTRYHKSTPADIPADILGEEQWKWLENELTNSPAQAHFLVSSFSILSPSIGGGEQWIDYKESWERLNRLIVDKKPKGLIVLTGDRHFGGMLSKKLDDGQTYYELMSSGLTHVAKSMVRTVLRAIYGRKNSLFEKNFGSIQIHWDLLDQSLPLQMDFNLHTDESMISPAWKKSFLLV